MPLLVLAFVCTLCFYRSCLLSNYYFVVHCFIITSHHITATPSLLLHGLSSEFGRHSSDPNTLFRENSPLSKLLKAYNSMCGRWRAQHTVLLIWMAEILLLIRAFIIEVTVMKVVRTDWIDTICEKRPSFSYHFCYLLFHLFHTSIFTLITSHHTTHQGVSVGRTSAASSLHSSQSVSRRTNTTTWIQSMLMIVAHLFIYCRSCYHYHLAVLDC